MFRSVLAHDFLIEFSFDFPKNKTRIIFYFDTFSLILNRNDTKKTTCLVFKLLTKYAADSAVTQKRSSRQLFFTRSNEFANKLKNYINRLMRALTANSANVREQQKKELSLPDAEDHENQCDTIFELQDGSFLLICTFDQFLEFMKNIIKNVNQKRFFVIDDNGDAQENKRLNSSKNKYSRWHPSNKNETFRFVDFQSFKLNYWLKFSANLVAKLPVELVFVEIMKIIKKILFSRETFKLFSRNEYLQLSSRLTLVFTLKIKKSRIYDIFEKYQVLKFHWRESNAIDRVMKTIKTMKQNQRLKNYLKISFDEIYIDEIQDLQCLEIELLLNMIKNDRAFHFAENTTQIISQNSHFRFKISKHYFMIISLLKSRWQINSDLHDLDFLCWSKIIARIKGFSVWHF